VIVVEKNHGGKWLPAVFSMVDPYCNVDTVWASDKKRTRAEPVSVLFEFHADSEPQVRGRIVGYQPELEDELTNTSFTSGEPSPNLLDAMVWGVSFLMLGIKTGRSGRKYKDQRLTGRR
jgi:phage terminase large subunit-like protein